MTAFDGGQCNYAMSHSLHASFVLMQTRILYQAIDIPMHDNNLFEG